MPELPEVETMCRGVTPIVGGVIEAVEIPKCERKPILISPGIRVIERRVLSRRITAINRVGKRVVVCLDSDDVIVFEPRMTGLVLIADPPSSEHLRFRLRLQDAAADELLYWDRRGLGSVRLMNPLEFESAFSSKNIGPDALQITTEQLQEKLGVSRREIKVALLDQKVVAGIGNIYASELLHMAGIHPRKRCDLISSSGWGEIRRCVLEVLHAAIENEGSTLSDGTYRNALNQPGEYQSLHTVYDRSGEPCRNCSENIVRIVQSQRATFYCPNCQPMKHR